MPSPTLTNLRIQDPVLTQLSIGYSNAEFVAESLYPIVPIDKSGVRVPIFDKDAFKLYTTERIPRAESNLVDPDDVNSISVNTTEHDLGWPIDYLEDKDASFPYQKHATFRTTEAIQLRREYAAAQMATNAATYAENNSLTLDSSTSFANQTADPTEMIEQGKSVIESVIAREPNVAVIGAPLFRRLKSHPKILEKLAHTRAKFVTVKDLQEIFNIPKIVVGRAIFKDGITSKSVWGLNMVMGYVPEALEGVERSYYEPSFGYTFRLRGNPTVDTYMKEGNKVQVVRTTDNFETKVTGSASGFLIKDI